MSGSDFDFGDLQADVAGALVERAPEDFAKIVLRAEMQDDNGAMTAWYAMADDSTHHKLSTGTPIYKLCKALRLKMAEKKGDFWKVMLLQVDGKTQSFEAHFEYEDAARWDTSKYREE